jgi:hypothetical protein
MNNKSSSEFCHALTTLFVYLGFVLAASSGVGQSYDLKWFQISAGGGTMKGNTFSVTTTEGQVLASSQLTGSSYSVSGGVWSYSLYSPPALPIMVISTTSSNTVKISWSSLLTGTELEVSTSLTAPSWTAASDPITDDGTNRFIFVSLSASQSRFYRFRMPQ